MNSLALISIWFPFFTTTLLIGFLLQLWVEVTRGFRFWLLLVITLLAVYLLSILVENVEIIELNLLIAIRQIITAVIWLSFLMLLWAIKPCLTEKMRDQKDESELREFIEFARRLGHRTNRLDRLEKTCAGDEEVRS